MTQAMVHDDLSQGYCSLDFLRDPHYTSAKHSGQAPPLSSKESVLTLTTGLIELQWRPTEVVWETTILVEVYFITLDEQCSHSDSRVCKILRQDCNQSTYMLLALRCALSQKERSRRRSHVGKIEMLVGNHCEEDRLAVRHRT